MADAVTAIERFEKMNPTWCQLRAAIRAGPRLPIA
jgi:hypothetical protein